MTRNFAKQTANLKNCDVWNETGDEQLNTFIFKHTALPASRQERFFSDTLGPVPGNQLAVERISWHAGKVLRPLLQFQCLFSLWGFLRILRVLNESSTMKIFASVLHEGYQSLVTVWGFVSENQILHFNVRAGKSPHARKGDPRRGERTSCLSRVECFSRALAFRSLYYPWGKMGDYS